MKSWQFVASAALLSTAIGGVQAQAASDPVYGGGSTLAGKVYRQIFDCLSTQTLTGGNPQVGQCTQKWNLPAQWLYAPVGSGAGKSAFRTNDPANFGTPSQSNTVPYTSNDHPGYPYAGVDFAGSDAELTQTDLDAYDATKYGPAKQVPMFIAPVAIPFNSGPNSNNATKDTFLYGSYQINHQIPQASSLLQLPVNALCGIFTGAITDWNDPEISAGNYGHHVAGTVAHTIKVVIRSDGSGTTELLTRHLAAACANSTHPYTGTVGTATASAFSQLLANNNANVIQVSGSGGIENTIKSTPYSIGYVSADFVKQVRNSANAIVAGGDPNGPVTANVQNLSGNYRPPSYYSAQQSFSTATPPAATDDNALDWGQPAGTDNPSAAYGYPIVGFTFVDTYTCHKTGENSALRMLQLFNNYFTGNFSKEVAKMLQVNGFAPVPTGYATNLRALLVGNAATRIANAGAAGTECATVTQGAR